MTQKTPRAAGAERGLKGEIRAVYFTITFSVRLP